MREQRFFRTLLIGSAMVTLLSLGATFDASAVTVDEERSATFYQDALKQLEDGNAAAAIIQLRNSLQQDPNNLDARLLLGQLYLASGDGPSAEKELSRVQSVRPSDETEIMLGNALMLQSKFEDVLATLSREAGTPELRREKLLLLGHAHFGLQEMDEAEALYSEVLAEAPQSAGANFALARLKAAANDAEAADEYLSTALEANPEFLEAWLLKAELEIRRRQFDAALAALDKADRIRPDDLRVQLSRAQVLLQSGDMVEGEKQVEAVLERAPNHTFAKYLKAGVAAARGEYDAADRILLTIQEDLREFVPAHLLNGIVKFNTGQYAQAEQWLSRYVAAQPQNLSAQRLLALTNLRLGNPQAAVRILEPLVAQHPNDAGSLQLLASSYMRVENYDGAAKIYEQVSRSGNPAQAQQARSTLALLGSALDIGQTPAGEAPAGDQPAGAATIDNAALGQMDIAPSDDLSKSILLILDYLKTRDFEAALAETEKLRLAHPDNPIVLNIEGGVYLAQGKDDVARERFEEALRIEPNFLSALNNLDRLDMRAGNPDAVEARMRDRLGETPTDQQMTLRLAQFLTSQGRPAEAQELLETARTTMPESTAIRQALIVAYLNDGKAEQAVPIAKEMAAIAPDDPENLTVAGQALLRANAPAEAAEVFRQLAAAQPDSDAAELSLAEALFAADQKDEAREILTGIRERAPDNVAATTGLVTFAMSEDDPEKAIQLASDLEAHNPVAAAQLKADVLVRTGRAPEAIALLSEAFQNNQVPELALNLFLVRRSAGETKAALADLKNWVEKSPEDAQSRLALASALLETGDYAGASTHYEQLLTVDPNNAAILNNLAWLKSELDQPNAIDYARRAYDLAPASPEVADTLGWLLVQADQTSEEGLTLLREAATAAPGNADIQYHLAYALHATGEGDKAQEILEKLLATDQPFMEREAAQLLLTELRG